MYYFGDWLITILQNREIDRRLRIVRVETTTDSRRIVGLLIPSAVVNSLLEGLSLFFYISLVLPIVHVLIFWLWFLQFQYCFFECLFILIVYRVAISRYWWVKCNEMKISFVEGKLIIALGWFPALYYFAWNIWTRLSIIWHGWLKEPKIWWLTRKMPFLEIEVRKLKSLKKARTCWENEFQTG